MRRVALYARGSAAGETIESQLRELSAVAGQRGWAVVETFIDESRPGRKRGEQRPGLERLLNAVIREEVDLVAAWSVDRLGRSLQELVALLEKLHAREVDLYLHKQELDTATPSGKAVYGMLELFAGYERAIIAERVNAGLAEAKARGRRLGRPPITPSLIEDIRQLRAKGHSLRFIADKLGVGRGTVEKYVKNVSANLNQ